jgi:hypothetical protein
VEHSDDKGARLESLRVALSIQEAELLCEQGNWGELEKAMEVSLSTITQLTLGRDQRRGGTI